MTTSRYSNLATLVLCAAVGVLGVPSAFAQAVDVAGAEALVQKNKCTKCHSVDKKKDGPPFKETAAKYKGKADAEAKLTKHLTSGPKIKIDGVEEEHQILKATEPETKNLVKYILSR
jgi:cytochrome c